MTVDFGAGSSGAEAVRAPDVLESTSGAVALLDRERRYIYVSTRAESMARLPREKLIGSVVWDLFPELKSATSYPELHRAMRDRVHTRFEEFYPPYEL